MRVIKWEDMIDPAREGRMGNEHRKEYKTDVHQSRGGYYISFGGALSLQGAAVRSGVGDMGIHGVFHRWRSIE